MTCKHCGVEIEDGIKFCTECGESTEVEKTEATEAETPVLETPIEETPVEETPDTEVSALPQEQYPGYEGGQESQQTYGTVPTPVKQYAGTAQTLAIIGIVTVCCCTGWIFEIIAIILANKAIAANEPEVKKAQTAKKIAIAVLVISVIGYLAFGIYWMVPTSSSCLIF